MVGEAVLLNQRNHPPSRNIPVDSLVNFLRQCCVQFKEICLVKRSQQKFICGNFGAGQLRLLSIAFTLSQISLNADKLSLLQMFSTPKRDIVPSAYTIQFLVHQTCSGFVLYAEREDQMRNVVRFRAKKRTSVNFARDEYFVQACSFLLIMSSALLE